MGASGKRANAPLGRADLPEGRGRCPRLACGQFTPEDICKTKEAGGCAPFFGLENTLGGVARNARRGQRPPAPVDLLINAGSGASR